MKKVKVYKPLWDYMDKQEGREEGSSFKKLKEEAKRQGYKAESSGGGKVSHSRYDYMFGHTWPFFVSTFKRRPEKEEYEGGKVSRKKTKHGVFDNETVRRLG